MKQYTVSMFPIQCPYCGEYLHCYDWGRVFHALEGPPQDFITFECKSCMETFGSGELLEIYTQVEKSGNRKLWRTPEDHPVLDAHTSQIMADVDNVLRELEGIEEGDYI